MCVCACGRAFVSLFSCVCACVRASVYVCLFSCMCVRAFVCTMFVSLSYKRYLKKSLSNLENTLQSALSAVA